jgi:hypothetical protein
MLAALFESFAAPLKALATALAAALLEGLTALFELLAALFSAFTALTRCGRGSSGGGSLVGGAAGLSKRVPCQRQTCCDDERQYSRLYCSHNFSFLNISHERLSLDFGSSRMAISGLRRYILSVSIPASSFRYANK